jgi:DNA-3-methyladenine glycosylase
MVELMSYPPVLPRDSYKRTTEVVARELLGKLLVRTDSDGEVVVRLTEVESYLGIDDPACHTCRGRRTPRTETMWGEAGHAYVYLIYGLHNCLNVVTVGPGQPEAVLIRGGVVEKGLEIVRARRGPKVGERSLTDGPGKMCQALAITRLDDGIDLCAPDSAIQICDDGARISEDRVQRLPRVGVDYAGEAASWPLRLRFDCENS